VIPVARKVWQPICLGRPAALARRLTIQEAIDHMATVSVETLAGDLFDGSGTDDPEFREELRGLVFEGLWAEISE